MYSVFWRGGGARGLGRARLTAAQGTAAGGTSTADCLWLRDVGGGEIDQPTKLAGHHRAEGQPRRHSAVSAHADTCAHAHRDHGERCHTTHACARSSAELLTVSQVPAADGAGATKPAGRRARGPCFAPLPRHFRRQRYSATRPRASGSAGEAWRPLALEPGHGPAAATPAAAVHGPAHAGHQPLARGQARRCSPRPNAGRARWPESEKLPAA